MINNINPFINNIKSMTIKILKINYNEINIVDMFLHFIIYSNYIYIFLNIATLTIFLIFASNGILKNKYTQCIKWNVFFRHMKKIQPFIV